MCLYVSLSLYLYLPWTINPELQTIPAGALTSNDEESEVSELGRLASAMPVDIPLVKLVKIKSERESERETLNSKPWTLNPKPSTLDTKH